jgi:hypothetical protein
LSLGTRTAYLALRGAFGFSIDGVVFDASDVNVHDLAAPQWGSHWIYRGFGEAVSLAFGPFVTAGLARQRARAAAIVGALAISIVYLLQNAAWIYFVYFANSRWESIEPWYQHAVEAAVIVGAPFIGYAVSGPALELNGPTTVGFAGINRLHFIWLWFAGERPSTRWPELPASTRHDSPMQTSVLRQCRNRRFS